MQSLLDIPIDSCPDHNKPLLTTLCQELGELERFGAKLLAQLGWVERLRRSAPAQQPRQQLLECICCGSSGRSAASEEGRRSALRLGE